MSAAGDHPFVEAVARYAEEERRPAALAFGLAAAVLGELETEPHDAARDAHLARLAADVPNRPTIQESLSLQ